MLRNLVALAAVYLFGGTSLILISGGTVLAQEQNAQRRISVSGTVETKTAPDQIVWSISLLDTDRDLRQAKAANDVKVRAVLALREQLNIAEGDLETGRLYIRREYERDERGRQGEFRHFAVSRNITIRQRDLNRFDTFLDALVTASELEASFSFETSRLYEIRAETRLRALQEARSKAAAMAEAVGARLGPVISIDEYVPGRGVPMGNQGYVESSPPVDQSSETFVPGAITVRVSVFATFALE